MPGSRIFFQGGGGGGPGPTAREHVFGRIFFICFCFVFLVLYLFYSLHKWSNGFITEKTILSDPEVIQHFPGGSNFFHAGSEC